MQMRPNKSLNPERGIKISEDKLLKQWWHRGSTEAFTMLYNDYYESSISFCIGLARNEHLAEELVQNTFCQIWEKGYEKKGKPISNFKNYLFAAITYNYYNYIRKKGRQAKFYNALKEPWQENYDCQFEDEDFIKKIFALYLNNPQSEVHGLKMQGYNDKEVGDKLNKTPDQVRGLGYRARQSLISVKSSILKTLFGM